MRLYHVTHAVNVAAILSDGFLDSTRFADFIGVWFSDQPLWDGGPVDVDSLPDGWACLTVDIPEAAAAAHLLEQDTPYREWCIPAAIVNQYEQRRLAAD